MYNKNTLIDDRYVIGIGAKCFLHPTGIDAKLTYWKQKTVIFLTHIGIGTTIIVPTLIIQDDYFMHILFYEPCKRWFEKFNFIFNLNT